MKHTKYTFRFSPAARENGLTFVLTAKQVVGKRGNLNSAIEPITGRSVGVILRGPVEEI